MEANSTSNGTETKKTRKRHKHLFAEIKKQMEFYFSDANLHKDRFIKKLMDQSEDKYVELSVFSKFNKLRALTEDMNLVAKALSSSDLLEVSADQLRVRRTRPLADPTDVDDRTVYVECLPRTATHEWVKKIFQECGTVVYVSLPKYRTSRDIKGFGFVEFETVKQAQKSCELLHNPPADTDDKLGKFPRANKQLKQLEHKARSQKIELPGNTSDPRLAKGGRRQRTVSESAVTDTRVTRKRCRTTSEGSDSLKRSASTDTEPQPKQARRDAGGSHKHRAGSTSSDSEPEPKQARRDAGGSHKQRDRSTSSDSEPEPKQARRDAGGSHKHRERSTSSKSASHQSDSDREDDGAGRKRKLDRDEGETGEEMAKSGTKKVRISEKVQVEEEEKEDGEGGMDVAQKKRSRHRKRKRKTKEVSLKKDLPELRVIPKTEWSKLRKEYLQLQKSSMSQLKHKLHELKNETEKDTVVTETSEKDATSEAQKKTITFAPNVIVKVSSQKELCRKSVKESACKCAEVVYADIVDGSTNGFLRCSSEAEARKLTDTDSDLYTYSLVQGTEEAKYWDKLKCDRENKLNRKSQPKQRGRDKIFKQAEKAQKLVPQQRTHVIFDDD